jgi:hypothetical protein
MGFVTHTGASLEDGLKAVGGISDLDGSKNLAARQLF